MPLCAVAIELEVFGKKKPLPIHTHKGISKCSPAELGMRLPPVCDREDLKRQKKRVPLFGEAAYAELLLGECAPELVPDDAIAGGGVVAAAACGVRQRKRRGAAARG